MKKLKDVLKGITYQVLAGSDDLEISDIKFDSRKVKENDLYVALIGYTSDGHDYIPDAIKNGAKVIMVSKMITIKEDVTVIKVDDTRIALAYASANYFDRHLARLPIPRRRTLRKSGEWNQRNPAMAIR